MREEQGKNIQQSTTEPDRLEAELKGQLDTPRSAAAEEGIADTNVAGGAELVSAIANLPGPGRVRLEAASARAKIRRGISNEGR